MPKVHTVKQGETLVQIGLKAGFRTLTKISDHPDNADLMQKRPDPNLVCPGDKLTLPDLIEKTLDYATGKEYVFEVPAIATWFRTMIKDDEGELCKGKRFHLEFDGQEVDGTTDGTGVIEQEIGLDTKEVKVTVWIDEGDGEDGFTWRVKLTTFEDIENVAGLQLRLNNVGFPCGPVTGEMNDQTRQAIREFQEHAELDPTGEPDEDTRRALAELHDK